MKISALSQYLPDAVYRGDTHNSCLPSGKKTIARGMTSENYVVVDHGIACAYQIRHYPKSEAVILLDKIPDDYQRWSQIIWKETPPKVKDLHFQLVYDVSYDEVLDARRQTAFAEGKPIPVSAEVYKLLTKQSSCDTVMEAWYQEEFFAVLRCSEQPFPDYAYFKMRIVSENDNENAEVWVHYKNLRARYFSDKYVILGELKKLPNKNNELGQLLRGQDPKKEFARRCGRIARKIGVKFEVSLAFRGNETEIKKFITSLQTAMAFDYDLRELKNSDQQRSSAEIKKLAIYTRGVDSSRLKEYIADCLCEQTILK